MDEVAPQVWKEVVAAGDSRDIRAWSERHGLGAWVIPYADDRLARGEADKSKWLNQVRAAIPRLDEAYRSQPVYDPSITRLSVFRRKVDLYVERVQAAARGAGLKPIGVIEDRHLRWLVRWQVLGHSPAAIAKAEGRHGDVRSLETDVRRQTRKLAERLGLPPRRPGKPGRPRRRR